MTQAEALRQATEHARTTDQPTFVYWDNGDYDWCTEDSYRYGSHQWLNQDWIVWGSIEGWYGN